jgi:hypothetical protein
MTWVTKFQGALQAGKLPTLAETRSELEELGISVFESEHRKNRHAHRIDAQDWRQQARQLLAAGFVPSPDNDITPAAIASALPRD